MELLSVRRSGGNWRLFHRHVRRSPLHTAQPPGCTIPHFSNSNTLPTLPTLLRAILPFTLVPIVALDSRRRRCLSPKFHANTHNHTTCQCPVKPLREREPWPAAIDKATQGPLQARRERIWVNRQNQLWNLSDGFPAKQRLPMAIVWDTTGTKNLWEKYCNFYVHATSTKNLWENSWKVQRPTLRTSCLQSQLWQFLKIIRNFFGPNLMNSPGKHLQTVIYCSIDYYSGKKNWKPMQIIQSYF